MLTTNGGGCVVDAVSQVSSGENPYISVAIMNSNYTNELLKKNDKFAISVLSKDVNASIINIFGMHSMRDINKFKDVETSEVLGLKIINDSIGFMVCEIVDSIVFDTHTLFIGKLIEADVLNEKEAMTYAYYQDHKENFIKVKTDTNKTYWICSVCGYVYEGENLPENFKCPKCGVDKSMFLKK